MFAAKERERSHARHTLAERRRRRRRRRKAEASGSPTRDGTVRPIANDDASPRHPVRQTRVECFIDGALNNAHHVKLCNLSQPFARPSTVKRPGDPREADLRDV
ncbi:MAG: hypothetical protein HC938_09225 [Nitrospira sp.]|nr:hypothetical protein [Nitrospira sp.]